MVLPLTAMLSEPPCTLTALSGMSANVLPNTSRFLACRTSTAIPATLSNVFDEILASCICTDPSYAPVSIAWRSLSGTPS